MMYRYNETTIRQCRIKFIILILWFCLVLLMVWHHAFWRDEVRALSLVKQSDSILSMIGGLHWEGHPALWYLMLRAAYFVFGEPWVLPMMSVMVGTAAVLLLVLRSPFGWGFIALLVFSKAMLFEYSVMARNYGISMLLLFSLAACYQRYRERNIVLGVLLFLLANTNLHSVLLTGAFLLFWLIDIVGEQGIRRTPAVRIYLLNAGIAVLGVIACVATLRPPFNDIIGGEGVWGGGSLVNKLLWAFFVPEGSVRLILFHHWPAATHLDEIKAVLGSLLVFGSLLGLVRWPAAFLAALMALIALSVFFSVVYPAYYRHAGLFVCFLVIMYWITREQTPRSELPFPAWMQRLVTPVVTLGWGMMILVVALQTVGGIAVATGAVRDQVPFSRSRDFGMFVGQHPELQNAIIMADPDIMVEALPYYIDNPTYLTREARFGNADKLTKNARLNLNLADILTTARALHARRGDPILILLAYNLDADQPQVYEEGPAWRTHTTPEEVRSFLASTRLLIRFEPAQSDETYAVYLLE